MLNNNNAVTVAGRECKVDLEAQLQFARKRKLKIEQDITQFWEFDDYYTAESASVTLLGAMHSSLKAAEGSLQRCLDEIDADEG